MGENVTHQRPDHVYEKSRKRSQGWSKEELDFLYQLNKERLEPHRKANPGQKGDELLPHEGYKGRGPRLDQALQRTLRWQHLTE